jgi:hypothetical protein
MTTSTPIIPEAWTPQNLLAHGNSDADQLEAALKLLYSQHAMALSKAVLLLPRTPGVYLLGMNKPDLNGYYSELVDLGGPLNTGSSREEKVGLLGRARAYFRKVERTSNLDVADVVIKAISLSRAQALSTELLLQDNCPTPFNTPGPVNGCGSAAQGGGRNSQRSKFNTLHPQIGEPPVPLKERQAIEKDLASWITSNRSLILPIMRNPS